MISKFHSIKKSITPKKLLQTYDQTCWVWSRILCRKFWQDVAPWEVDRAPEYRRVSSRNWEGKITFLVQQKILYMQNTLTNFFFFLHLYLQRLNMFDQSGLLGVTSSPNLRFTGKKQSHMWPPWLQKTHTPPTGT